MPLNIKFKLQYTSSGARAMRSSGAVNSLRSKVL